MTCRHAAQAVPEASNKNKQARGVQQSTQPACTWGAGSAPSCRATAAPKHVQSPRWPQPPAREGRGAKSSCWHPSLIWKVGAWGSIYSEFTWHSHQGTPSCAKLCKSWCTRFLYCVCNKLPQTWWPQTLPINVSQFRVRSWGTAKLESWPRAPGGCRLTRKVTGEEPASEPPGVAGTIYSLGFRTGVPEFSLAVGVGRVTLSN